MHIFHWGKKKPSPGENPIRDLLFGDAPWSAWASSSGGELLEPWRSFLQAKTERDTEQKAQAIGTLESILARENLETRHYLQAWYFLRQLGAPIPQPKAKEVLGVVVEVGLDQGLDILAAYADRTARYFNYSGAAVVWDRPDDSLDAPIDSLLAAGKVVVEQTEPSRLPRPAAPVKGQVGISLLTPGGLHLGQGTFDAFAQEPAGGAVVVSAARLMKALVEKAKKSA